jgi:hypothetical protein
LVVLGVIGYAAFSPSEASAQRVTVYSPMVGQYLPGAYGGYTYQPYYGGYAYPQPYYGSYSTGYRGYPTYYSYPSYNYSYPSYTAPSYSYPSYGFPTYRSAYRGGFFTY